MEIIQGLFKEFYKNYNREAVERAHGLLPQQSLFSKMFKKTPFSVEVRFKDGIFAMQLSAENIILMELVTVIAYFFDKYSVSRNCTYTKEEKNIRKFFTRGIDEFIEFGGKISVNIDLAGKEKLVDIINGNAIEAELRSRLVENFDMLCCISWNDYRKKITEMYYVKKDTTRLSGITDGFEI